jgi:hypothetical protein
MTTTRSSNYWAEFPMTYRAEQVAEIMRWVAAGESGVVVGGSGTGKSNLTGFLSSRPDAVAPHVTVEPDKYCFLHLDINSLPKLTVPYFYRGLEQALQDAAEALGPEVQQAMQQLTERRINWEDAFEVLIFLQKAHRLVIHQAGKKVVWLLDRFDEACRRLEAQPLNSLRSLRDQFKGHLCYVVFTRHPLARLRDPGEIDEFHEIVAANTCWVGPMNERDARWIARQMAERLNTTFTEAEVTQLIEVTGGLPAFMKLGCSALAEGALDKGGSAQIWTEQLLARLEFERNCEEIWNDLLPEEQNVLAALTSGANELQVDQNVVAYLEQGGLLIRPAPDAEHNIFSPILERFISRQRGAGPGILEWDPTTGEVRRGGVFLDVDLTAHEHRLLSYFQNHPDEICQKDDLMRAVWPDEKWAGSDDRLAQLIKRLRQKIEPDPGNPTYIQTVRGRGYRFVQPEA